MANIIEISDLSAAELDVFARLTEAQLRNRLESSKGIFIAESPKVIHLALNAGYAPISLLMEQKHIDGDGASVIERCGNIPVYTARRHILESLTGYALTRGVLCAMHRRQPSSPIDIIDGARRIAVLDGIVDSTNIGAIFRSAAALGIDGLLLSENCCDPLCRRAVRVSMGTVFQIPWTFIPGDYITFLQDNGFSSAAMALETDSVSVDDPTLLSEERIAIILGNEGNGLSPQRISQCDYTVCIPMHHSVDSLNVAAAAAVAFWQLCKK